MLVVTNIDRDVKQIMKNMKKILILAMCLMPAALWTHPHIWLTSRSEINFSRENLNQIVMHWTFDKIYSRTLIDEFDRNKNFYFDRDEAGKLKSEAFSSLISFNYMSVLIIDGKNFPVKRVNDFRAFITPENKVKYSFTIPVGKPLKNSGKISLIIYDKTFFCHFTPETENPVKLTGAGSYELKIKAGKSKKYFNGYIYPDMITINYRRK